MVPGRAAERAAARKLVQNVRDRVCGNLSPGCFTSWMWFSQLSTFCAAQPFSCGGFLIHLHLDSFTGSAHLTVETITGNATFACWQWKGELTWEERSLSGSLSNTFSLHLCKMQMLGIFYKWGKDDGDSGENALWWPMSYNGPQRKSVASSGLRLVCPAKPCQGLPLVMRKHSSCKTYLSRRLTAQPLPSKNNQDIPSISIS